VFRLTCSRRLAARAAGAIRACAAGRRRRAGTAAIAAMATMTMTLALTACEGGAIGQSTPVSNGTSFVPGGPGATLYRTGSRPPAPPVTGTTLTGGKLTLAGYRHGGVVVVNFWGSWCAPCRQEAPSLAALASRFAAGRVRFLGVDIRDSPASAMAFLRTYRISYPSLNDPGDEIALAFRGTVPPVGIPTTLVIDRSGRIAARIVGGVSYNGLRAMITRIAGAS
jgi:thiol-disulfide isomerase/thioredoxin